MEHVMVARMLIVALCLGSGSAVLTSRSQPEHVPIREPFAVFPMEISTWRGERAPDFDEAILRELGVDEYLNTVYSDPAGAIAGLYVGYYASQRQGDAIHSPANCLPGAGWQPIDTGRLQVHLPPPGAAAGTLPERVVKVNRWVIQKGDEQHLVLYWYQSHGRVVASEYSSKVHLVLDAIRLNRTDAALVRVITPITRGSSDGRGLAERTAVSFVRSLFPVLERFLPA
jgi:EpsI family protein